ncbi:MAG: MerR family transcriptional regulator [Gammaproteobacteria bacterium]|jgi:DNA-binding transcriptional MerR regulator|nr:MAG: MerR family transcriptional regulator [Gammaproteobacteria bacterium]
MAPPLKMRDLEARTDVSREAIHFYLREGLLPEPERPKRNVAHYNEGHVARIKLIKRLQEERFLPLSVIKQVLERAEAAADDVGGLASFEFALASLLNGDVPEPDQALEVVAERAGMEAADVCRLAEAGVIRLTDKGGEAYLDFRDAAIVEHWGRVLEDGFGGLPGYDEGYLGRYADALKKLAEAEVELFLSNFGRELTDETAAVANRGIEATNEIIARMRTQALLRNLADRVSGKQVQGES